MFSASGLKCDLGLRQTRKFSDDSGTMPLGLTHISKSWSTDVKKDFFSSISTDRMTSASSLGSVTHGRMVIEDKQACFQKSQRILDLIFSEHNLQKLISMVSINFILQE